MGIGVSISLSGLQHVLNVEGDITQAVGPENEVMVLAGRLRLARTYRGQLPGHSVSPSRLVMTGP